jgi:hypothetical protein
MRPKLAQTARHLLAVNHLLVQELLQAFAVRLSLVLVILGGAWASFWGNDTPWKSFWVGFSVPIIISSVANQFPSDSSEKKETDQG